MQTLSDHDKCYLLWVEETLVGSLPDLVHHTWLQVHEHSTRHVLATSGLAEEGGEAVISCCLGIRLHGSIRLKT